MRFLADENFPKPMIDQLRRESHDVLWAGTDFPSTADNWLLERAEEEGRIMLTLDHDFWQLAVQRRRQLRRSELSCFEFIPRLQIESKSLSAGCCISRTRGSAK